MPVTSTVQTPEMFKGRLKEYQLKGLQWLVNCYEQVVNMFEELSLRLYLYFLIFHLYTGFEWNSC